MGEEKITNEEIMSFLKDTVATKEDLNGMATKEDLNGMATKEDLKGMATKEDLGKLKYEILDSMDDKLANIKGDLVVMMRGEDKKVSELISVLHNKNILTDEEAKRLLALRPFPQLS